MLGLMWYVGIYIFGKLMYKEVILFGSEVIYGEVLGD